MKLTFNPDGEQPPLYPSIGDPGRQEREEERRQLDKGKVTWVKVWSGKWDSKKVEDWFRNLFKRSANEKI